MKVEITNSENTIQWDGIYYFALSDYPNISSWELKKLLAFLNYEKRYGRKTEIVCENTDIMAAVHAAIADPKSVEKAEVPAKITECTYCRQGGCRTDFVCHTATADAAKKIITSGRLLSAVRAFGKSGAELSRDSRNAAGDPADYFEYVMFNWGNCTGGYRLSMERELGRDPTEDELNHRLIPGIRFYFQYEDLIRHSGSVFDGYHPVKIKDELILSEYLYACVIPTQCRDEFEKLVPITVASRVYYVPHGGLGLRDWTNKVYEFVCAL